MSEETKADAVVGPVGPAAAPTYELNAMIPSASTDVRIVTAMTRYGERMITVEEAATLTGFTPKEMTLLGISMIDDFDGSWIRYTPDIMRTMGYTAMKDVVKNVLKAQYAEDTEWKYLTDEDDPEVKKWDINSTGSLLPVVNKANQGGPARLKLAVKGHIIQMMFMRCGTSEGRSICEFFIKLGALVRFIRDYHNEINMRQMQRRVLALQMDEATAREQKARADEDAKVLRERNEELARELKAKDEALKVREQIFDQLADSLQVHEPDGWAYIAFSNHLAARHHYKAGKATNLAVRLAGYNTYADQDTRIKYCAFWRVFDPGYIEGRIKRALRCFQIPHGAPQQRQDETYHVNIVRMLPIVKHICEAHIIETALINDAIVNFRADFLATPVIPAALPLPAVETYENKTQSRVILPKVLRTAQTQDAKTDQAKRVINSYLAEVAQTDYDIVANLTQAVDPKIEIKWDELLVYFVTKLAHGEKQNVIKPGSAAITNAWLDVFKSIMDTAGGAITFIYKVPRKKAEVATRSAGHAA